MKKLCLLLCVLPLVLTGCTREANRIYTVCCYDTDTLYVYDADSNFYTYHSDGTLTPNINPNLENKPALQINPEKGDYNFVYELPGRYRGTLKSVNRYVQRLLDDDGSLTVTYADCKLIDLIVKLPDYSVRVIFNVHGDVRIYCSNGEVPPYINED